MAQRKYSSRFIFKVSHLFNNTCGTPSLYISSIFSDHGQPELVIQSVGMHTTESINLKFKKIKSRFVLACSFLIQVDSHDWFGLVMVSSHYFFMIQYVVTMIRHETSVYCYLIAQTRQATITLK